jgi:uncharacterized membrane protein
MMSQNRQAAVGGLRAENDYQVNIKSELEIRSTAQPAARAGLGDVGGVAEPADRMLQRLLEQATQASEPPRPAPEPISHHSAT